MNTRFRLKHIQLKHIEFQVQQLEDNCWNPKFNWSIYNWSILKQTVEFQIKAYTIEHIEFEVQLKHIICQLLASTWNPNYWNPFLPKSQLLKSQIEQSSISILQQVLSVTTVAYAMHTRKSMYNEYNQVLSLGHNGIVSIQPYIYNQ